MSAPGSLHHIELWVPDLAATKRGWGWLLSELGPEHCAANIEDTHGYEIGLVADPR